jgi:hypothetical protein
MWKRKNGLGFTPETHYKITYHMDKTPNPDGTKKIKDITIRCILCGYKWHDIEKTHDCSPKRGKK